MHARCHQRTPPTLRFLYNILRSALVKYGLWYSLSTLSYYYVSLSSNTQCTILSIHVDSNVWASSLRNSWRRNMYHTAIRVSELIIKPITSWFVLVDDRLQNHKVIPNITIYTRNWLWINGLTVHSHAQHLWCPIGSATSRRHKYKPRSHCACSGTTSCAGTLILLSSRISFPK